MRLMYSCWTLRDSGEDMWVHSGRVTVDQNERILAILNEQPPPVVIKPTFQVEIPCIAYRHMTVSTDEWLQSAASGFSNPPGFAVALVEGTCFLRPPLEEDRADYPQDLQDIFAFADKHAKFGWLMLDVDGDEVDLPVYVELPL